MTRPSSSPSVSGCECFQCAYLSSLSLLYPSPIFSFSSSPSSPSSPKTISAFCFSSSSPPPPRQQTSSSLLLFLTSLLVSPSVCCTLTASRLLASFLSSRTLSHLPSSHPLLALLSPNVSLSSLLASRSDPRLQTKLASHKSSPSSSVLHSNASLLPCFLFHICRDSFPSQSKILLIHLVPIISAFQSAPLPFQNWIESVTSISSLHPLLIRCYSRLAMIHPSLRPKWAQVIEEKGKALLLPNWDSSKVLKSGSENVILSIAVSLFEMSVVDGSLVVTLLPYINSLVTSAFSQQYPEAVSLGTQLVLCYQLISHSLTLSFCASFSLCVPF
jgi:hypothetical protein